MKEIVLITGLANKDPECWKVFKESGLYRETINSAIDALRAEFDLVGTDMDIDQTKREELFKEFYKQLKKDNYLNSYLADKERIAFLAWLRTKAINLLYDKVVVVSHELLVKNLINKKQITTKLFFYGDKNGMSIMPSILHYLKEHKLTNQVNPNDISTITYQVFIERVKTFRQGCSLITYFYNQHLFQDAVDEYFGTDRHKLYKFLDIQNQIDEDYDFEIDVQDNIEADESNYQKSKRKAIAYNDNIFTSLMNELDDSSIDNDYYKTILNSIYQKMTNNGYEQYVKVLTLHFSTIPFMSYRAMSEILNIPEGTIKTHLYRAKDMFLSYINNCPKNMRTNIVKQIFN